MLKKVIRNSAYTIVAQIVVLLLGLLFAGMTIRYLGPAIAGFFLIASSILSWTQMAGGGSFQSPAIQKLSLLFVERDFARSRSLVRTVTSANLLISFPFVLATVFAFPILFSWSKLDLSLRPQAFLVIVFASIGFIAEQWSVSLKTVYDGHQRFDLSAIISISFGLIGNLARLAVLIIYKNMVSLAVINLVISGIRLLTDMILVNRLIGGGIFPGWEKGVLKPLMSFGLWSWLGNTSNVLYYNITNLILTKGLGSAVLPYVILPQNIVLQIGQFLNNGSYFLFPTLAGQGKSVREDIRRIQDRLRWFIGSVSIAVYGGLFLAGPWFLTFLVNKDFAAAAYYPLALYCIFGIFYAQMIIFEFSTMAIGKIHPSVIIGIVTSVMAVAATFLLIPRMGYIGICVAQLLIIPRAVVHTVWCQGILGIKRSYLKSLAPYVSPGIGIACWILLVFAFRHLHPQSPVEQVAVWMAGFIIFIFLIWAQENFLFRKTQRWTTVVNVGKIIQNYLKKGKKSGEE